MYYFYIIFFTLNSKVVFYKEKGVPVGHVPEKGD